MMLHHDQSKIMSNEFMYHSDGRYVCFCLLFIEKPIKYYLAGLTIYCLKQFKKVDDAMMDEFMIPGGESFNELNQLENPFTKSSLVSGENIFKKN